MKEEYRRRVRREIQECILEQNFEPENLKNILASMRALYDLDAVFFASNSFYRYQLKTIFSETGKNVDLRKYDDRILTVEEYDEMVRQYMKEPVSEYCPYGENYSGTVENASDDSGKFEFRSMLHHAILKNSEYFGTVGFLSKEKRDWRHEEKEDLTLLSRMFLLYIGFNGLDRMHERKSRLTSDMIRPNTKSCFFVDLMAGKCHGVLISHYLNPKVREWMDYTELLEIYVNTFMESVYGKQFQSVFSPDSLKAQLSGMKRSISLEYPRILDNTAGWFRCTATLLDEEHETMPHYVCLAFDDITEETQKSAYWMHASEQEEGKYRMIASVDLDTEQYSVLVDHRSEEESEMKYSAVCGYREMLQQLITESIEYPYNEQYRERFSIENMKTVFQDQNRKLSYEFPFAAKERRYWMKLEAVPAQNYSEKSRCIIFYYSDLTEDKNKEFQLESIRRELREEQEQMQLKDQQLLMDPLTGIYNRKGFETITESFKGQNRPIGFIMLDIDNFKNFNDNFGHEFGDEVLIMAAKQLKSVFRNEDKVFRMGGDEFSLLLCDCKADAWDSIRKKFSSIHRFLREAAGKNIDITMSGGLCFSSDGYHDEMSAIADDAMYYTKRNGRAGLTLIDMEGKVLQTWKDSMASEQMLSDSSRNMSGRPDYEEAIRLLNQMSYYDMLTSCKNRNAYNRMVNEENLSGKKSIGMIMINVNGLKAVNAAMGNKYGDQVIRRTVKIISSYFEQEQLYRISGGQFVQLVFDQPYDDFSDAADRLAERMMIQEEGLASVGYYWDEQGLELSEIEHRTDAIMESGKNQYYLTYYSESVRRPAFIRHMAEKLAKSEFVVYLQPERDVKTKKVYGAEALVRMIDEAGNAVVPKEFLHVLEQENLIADVDFFVLEKVCETLVRWEKEKRKNYRISCNFSGNTLSEYNFVHRVEEILERTGVDASGLIFEVTEASNAVPVKKMTEIMTKLQKKKITFTLDDMGSEDSTFQLLKLPMITAIKFDRSLITKLEKDDREQFIMENMIRLCHGLGMNCIAEGVENEDQLNMLKKLGCDRVQGYLTGEPMPIEAFEQAEEKF